MAQVRVWRAEDDLRPARAPGRPGGPTAPGGVTGAQGVGPGQKAKPKPVEADEELVGRFVKIHLLGLLAGAGTDGRTLTGTLRGVTRYLLVLQVGAAREFRVYKHAIIGLEPVSKDA